MRRQNFRVFAPAAILAGLLLPGCAYIEASLPPPEGLEGQSVAVDVLAVHRTDVMPTDLRIPAIREALERVGAEARLVAFRCMVGPNRDVVGYAPVSADLAPAYDAAVRMRLDRRIDIPERGAAFLGSYLGPANLPEAVRSAGGSIEQNLRTGQFLWSGYAYEIDQPPPELLAYYHEDQFSSSYVIRCQPPNG